MIKNNKKNELKETNMALNAIRRENEDQRREILKLKLNYDEVHNRVLDNKNLIVYQTILTEKKEKSTNLFNKTISGLQKAINEEFSSLNQLENTVTELKKLLADETKRRNEKKTQVIL